MILSRLINDVQIYSPNCLLPVLQDMICAIATLESDRQPLATQYNKKSKETTVGIMQILPKTAQWLVRYELE